MKETHIFIPFLIAGFLMTNCITCIINNKDYKMNDKEKLQWIKICVNDYLSEKTIDEINPIYYRDWMLNVRNKIIGTIEDNEQNTEKIKKET